MRITNSLINQKMAWIESALRTHGVGTHTTIDLVMQYAGAPQRPRLFRRDGAGQRPLSPRLSRPQMYTFLEGMEAVIKLIC